MSAFKVGDRVRIMRLGAFIECHEQGLVAGNTGTVVSGVEGGAFIGVALDNAVEPPPPPGLGWHFWPDEIELISTGGAQ